MAVARIGIVWIGGVLLLAGCAPPLHRAAAAGNTSRALALLDGGADINRPADFGKTPLLFALEENRLETAKALIERGANPNRVDSFGLTPLDYAIRSGNNASVQLLLGNGAKPTLAAAEYAEHLGHHDIVSLLQKARSEEDTKARQMTAVSPESKQIRGSQASDIVLPRERLSERPNDFAVVIGIEGYSNDLPAAQFAERDARAVQNHLVWLGIPEHSIKNLIGNRATKANLEAYLEEWLPRNVREDSRVFFYFSGHGAPDPTAGQAYLLPWDGNPSFLKKTAYPLKRLYAQLNALKAKQVIVALDSCFSGSGGRSVLAQGARPLVTQVDTAIAPGGKVTVFAASAPNEITATLQEQGHGIFTYYFLKGLGGEAKDASGAITPRGLYEYLKPKVQDAASRQNRDQTPALEGSLDGEIVRYKQ